MTGSYRPLHSLAEGHWFKLICGASFQHLPAIRNLALTYAMAGADCVDVAADPAVIAAARDGLEVAAQLMSATADPWSLTRDTPWLMVSLNDGEDPHFRKAAFDPITCPTDCPRPCETICPTNAISIDPSPHAPWSGVKASRCYGCGRCVPICPLQKINTRSYLRRPEEVAPLVFPQVDAIEIHTQPGRQVAFHHLWQAIQPWIGELKLVAISCPHGEDFIGYLRQLYELISPLPVPLIWQIDGRPMSGDIGDGTTRTAVRLGQQALSARLPGGYIQLAGGTNRHTVTKLRQLRLLKSSAMPRSRLSLTYMGNRDAVQWRSEEASRYIAGIAYGSYARQILAPLLEQAELEAMGAAPSRANRLPDDPVRSARLDLEAFPDLLHQAVGLAGGLVSQLKSAVPPLSSVAASSWRSSRSRSSVESLPL